MSQRCRNGEAPHLGRARDVVWAAELATALHHVAAASTSGREVVSAGDMIRWYWCFIWPVERSRVDEMP